MRDPPDALVTAPREEGGAEVHLDPFFELSLDLLTVAGFDGYFKRLSPMWSKTLGWTMEELFSRPLVEFVHPDDRVATLESRSRVKNGIPLLGHHNRYRCKDGSYRWLEWRSVANPELQLVYAVARDITDQRTAEQQRQVIQEQLRVAERMASVGRLAGGVAHEINNPLAFLMANLRAAILAMPEVEGPTEELKRELQEMLADALEGAERVRTIVRGLGTFAQLGSEPRGPLALLPVLEESLQAVSTQLPPQVRVVKAFGELPLVEADTLSLGEVFRHLLSNAAQAFPKDQASAKEIQVITSTGATGNAVVEIRDTGVGMSAQTLRHLFEPFVSTREVGKGTGLGLAICHNLVTGLGGTVKVESHPGLGTTVRVELPPLKDKASGVTAPGAAAPPDP